MTQQRQALFEVMPKAPLQISQEQIPLAHRLVGMLAKAGLVGVFGGIGLIGLWENIERFSQPQRLAGNLAQDQPLLAEVSMPLDLTPMSLSGERSVDAGQSAGVRGDRLDRVTTEAASTDLALR